MTRYDYGFEVNRIVCLFEAPSREAVEKHHEKYGIKCTWITEVEATA
jgi:hypothetical protein